MKGGAALLFFCFSAAYAGPLDLFVGGEEEFIPTVEAGRGECRNHSLLYAENLKKFRLWAVEMYDASSKSSNGILYGSTYDLGNFDQCMAIRVPLNSGEFHGKYCLAKFVIHPPKDATKNIHFDSEDYRRHYNVSAWDKIEAFRDKDNRITRNELYYSFCIPSSCSHNDLQQALEKTLNKHTPFKMQIEVTEKLCQVQEDTTTFSYGSIVFLSFVALVFLVVAVASCYDLVTTKMQDLEDYRLPGKFDDFLMCFSFPKNLKKVASKSENDDGLDCIAGIKVLSMFFIILGHRCMFVFGSPLENPPFIEYTYKRVDAALILNGPIIVNTFFVISGFLASYLILSKIEYLNNISRIGMLYLHRILRIVPAYAVVIAFYCTLFVKIGSGPFWKERVGVEQERCLKNWWLNLLFINNYVNTKEICMFQSWYLDCDIHFYLITPLIVLLLHKKPIAGLLTTVLLIITSIIAAFVTVYINNADGILLLYTKLLKDPVLNETFRNIYIPSHMRASPYFIGVLGGYLKYQMKVKGMKLSKYTVRIGWVLGISIAFATIFTGFIFYVPHVRRDTLFSAFYGAMHHATWSVCMAFLIMVVSSGHGQWVEPLFSWQPFIMLSRITYTTFVGHGAIQIFTAAYIRQPIYSGVFNVFYMAAADIVYSYLIGFVLSMYFEAPVIALEKLIFYHRPKNNGVSRESSLNTTSEFGEENRGFESGMVEQNIHDINKKCYEKS